MGSRYTVPQTVTSANGSSKYTLLFPLVVPPASDGWSFPKRPLPNDHAEASSLHAPELARGLVSAGAGDMGGKGGDGAESGNGRMGKYVMGDDGSLTDDEEGGGGWMDDS